MNGNINDCMLLPVLLIVNKLHNDLMFFYGKRIRSKYQGEMVHFEVGLCVAWHFEIMWMFEKCPDLPFSYKTNLTAQTKTDPRYYVQD